MGIRDTHRLFHQSIFLYARLVDKILEFILMLYLFFEDMEHKIVCNQILSVGFLSQRVVYRNGFPFGFDNRFDNGIQVFRIRRRRWIAFVAGLDQF